MVGLKCPKCATIVQTAPGESPICPRCGFGAPTAGRNREPPQPPRPVEPEPVSEPAPDPVPAEQQAAREPEPTPREANDDADWQEPTAQQQPANPAPAPAMVPSAQAAPAAAGYNYPSAPPQYIPVPYPAQQPQQVTMVRAPSQGAAVVGLILNIFIWPGLGSLIGGRQEGWAQGFLFLIGVFLIWVVIGFFIIIPVYIWGIVTGVNMISDASAARHNAYQHH